jgi:hypothetical protein
VLINNYCVLRTSHAHVIPDGLTSAPAGPPDGYAIDQNAGAAVLRATTSVLRFVEVSADSACHHSSSLTHSRSCCNAHDNVADVGVVGLPDALFG